MTNVQMPTYEDLMNPAIEAIRQLGGSATIEELNSKVLEILDLPNDIADIIHDPSRGSHTEVEYRLAWSRTYLKKFGILENSSRGVWSFTPEGRKIQSVSPKEVTQHYRDLKRKSKSMDIEEIEDDVEETTWKEELLSTLMNMDPSAFERLIQRFLRESGFIQVEVTGRSGDGGIDGKGILRLGGLLSFHVLFQCKRYQGSVTPSQVRDFRGAMVGRADKGLLVTTGTYTKDAVKEATRDGATAIDLIDGDLLVEKLKDLNLGIETKLVSVEEVVIDHEWFSNI
jgi:restriction system protein